MSHTASPFGRSSVLTALPITYVWQIGSGLLIILFPPTVPLKMFESRFENIEKITKKQNKEQVPPPAEMDSKKPVSTKPAKKATNSFTSSQPIHKNLEEAFKAVSETNKTIVFSENKLTLQPYYCFEYHNFLLSCLK